MQLNREEGFKEGIEKGIEKGIEQEKIKVAKSLLDRLDDEKISIAIELAINEIKKSRN